MELDKYQERAFKTAIYPDAGSTTVEALTYTALGCAGESGEVTNEIKKTLRDDGGVLTEGRREALIEEVGDVLWYVAMLSLELGIRLETVAQLNLDKLEMRHHG